MPEPKVDKAELDQVLATYRLLYQRSRVEAELAMTRLRLPEVPTRDDISRNSPTQAFTWDPESDG